MVRIADLSGLRMKTPGGIFDNIAKRYGIVPVAMSFNEAYEAIQRNIIDLAISQGMIWSRLWLPRPVFLQWWGRVCLVK